MLLLLLLSPLPSLLPLPYYTAGEHRRCFDTATRASALMYAYSELDSLRGSSVKIGTIQRRLAWPLRKDDTHKSRSVKMYAYSETYLKYANTHPWSKQSAESFLEIILSRLLTGLVQPIIKCSDFPCSQNVRVHASKGTCSHDYVYVYV